jgi:NAD(P) transhydrogenase subunit alpha
MPFHASEMYARTVYNFLTHLVHNGAVQIDVGDELTRATLVTHLGQIVNEVAAKRSIA